MPELTPLDDNRQEHFLNGEDLEPITRREHFYAGRESELPAGHQEPETREEWFIQKYRGGGGDVTVVPLSVTENGTYSEEGKAYSPVSVNVPLPQNAYLLKSVNTPTPIASFNDGEDMVMPTLKVAIEPQQDLHGYDSPWVGGAGKNKCDLSAFTHTGVTTDRGDVSTVNNRLFSVHIPVKSDTTYTLSLTGSKNGENIYANRITYFDSNDTFIERYVPGTTQTATFTTLPNARYLQIDLRTSSLLDIEISDITSIQLEEGSTATAYAPYSNICPISGWDEVNVTRTGKNLAFKQKAGTIGTSGNFASSTIYDCFIAKVKSGVTYINNSDNPIYAFYTDEPSVGSNAYDNTRYSGVTFTAPIDGYVAVRCTRDLGGQIELGTTATTYEPYAGTTYTIDLDGTRYGGELDVVSGSYFDCESTIQLSSIDSFSSDAVNANGYIRYNCIVSDKAQNFNIMCDKIKVINTTVGSDASSELISGASTNNRLYFTIDSTRLTGDLSTTSGRNQALKTLLQADDIKVAYELATPLTIQLTPTAVKSLRGVNNVYANTGDIKDAEYFSKEV